MRIKRGQSLRTHRPSGYTKGQWKMVSDRSGQVFLSSDIKKEWTGLLVAKHEWEPRHPQEFVRGVVDDYAVRNARPPAALLSTISYTFATGFVVERDSENIVLRDGSYVINSRAVLGTEKTETAGLIYLYGGELGSDTHVSDLTLKLTLDDLSHRQWLKIQYSLDGSVWYDLNTGEIRAILDNLQNNTEAVIPIGQYLQFIQLVLDPPGVVTSTHTVSTFTLR